jgi:hypothetical protein
VDDDRNESDLERWDRNFAELLQELRVAQTGGQILFAFLLTLPFSARFFDETTSAQRGVYIFTLVVSAISMAFMIAPVSYHRQVFRQGRKPELVRAASRMAQAGLFAMLLSVAGAVYFALDVAVDHAWAPAMVTLVVTVYVLLWYVLPRIRG